MTWLVRNQRVTEERELGDIFASSDVERLVARTPWKVHLNSALCCFLRVVMAFAALIGSLRVAFPAPFIVSGQPPPAASLRLIKLRQIMEPATLLAKPLSETCNHHNRCFGVKLTDLVAAMVPLCISQISTTSLCLT
ncbi:hypothetical protein V8G54_024758 [Vigna mungo]|uniref:Uncharacterized protein n=1 Tax=Vigna mungo TaxID=3915 RepID=A0AAQ3N7H8_VIGMU